jgi:uncharacterized cofD-like protein
MQTNSHSLPNVVVIGGGHGVANLLHALKSLPICLTAIVSVSDDGGSTGKIRAHYPMPAPGDVRNCLLALAEDNQADNHISQLGTFRFSPDFGPELSGHNLGNLLLAALTEQYHGDFAQAVNIAHTLWRVKGRVLPVTGHPITLYAQLTSGEILHGESHIGKSNKPVDHVWLHPENHLPTEGVYATIVGADIILIGPGSLYTSVIPPLLTPTVADAIRRSSAKKAYLCNLIQQEGETSGYTASNHIDALEKHLGAGLFSLILLNTKLPETEGDTPFVRADIPAIIKRGYIPVTGRYWEFPETEQHATHRLVAFVEWLLASSTEDFLRQWQQDHEQEQTAHQLPTFVTINQRIVPTRFTG